MNCRALRLQNQSHLGPSTILRSRKLDSFEHNGRALGDCDGMLEKLQPLGFDVIRVHDTGLVTWSVCVQSRELSWFSKLYAFVYLEPCHPFATLFPGWP